MPGRDWNKEFQTCLERLWGDGVSNSRVLIDSSEDLDFAAADSSGLQKQRENADNAIRELRLLSDEFAANAVSLAKDIIAAHLQLSSRSTSTSTAVSGKDSYTRRTNLTPVTADVGGAAGGEKFVLRDEFLFAKFAVDSLGLYGGDEYAAKAAVHEFTSLSQVLECRVRGLHVPLMCLVDYLGFRISVQSILPIVGEKPLLTSLDDSSGEVAPLTGNSTAYSNVCDTSDLSAGAGSPILSLSNAGYDVSIIPRVSPAAAPAQRRSTLVCGSADGGRTVLNSDASSSAKLASVGAMLNVAPHYVYNWTKTQRAHVQLAVDVECHIGTDGRCYLLDSARVFPPAVSWTTRSLIGSHECPALRRAWERYRKTYAQSATDKPQPAARKGAFLCELLRPELVRECSHALCADAFSAFLVDDMAAHEERVSSAMMLLGTNIARFAADLDLTAANLEISFPELVAGMHRRGINLRYAGILRQRVTSGSLKYVLLTEMIARATKNVIRLHMRALRSPSIFDHHSLICQYFNLLFSDSEKSTTYWCTVIKDSLTKRFIMSLDEVETEVSFDLRKRVILCPLFERLSLLLGLEWRSDVWSRLLTDAVTIQRGDSWPRTFLIESLLPDLHLERINPRTRSMHRVSFEEATAFSRRAVAASEMTSSLREELFDAAELKYRESIERKPDNFRAFHNWGLSLQTRAAGLLSRCKGLTLSDDALADVRRSLMYLVDAQDKFSKAAETSSGNGEWLSWCLLANVKVDRAQVLQDFAVRGVDLRFDDFVDEADIRSVGRAAGNKLGFVDPPVLIGQAVQHYKYAFDMHAACTRSARSDRQRKDSFQLLYNWAGALLTKASMIASGRLRRSKDGQRVTEVLKSACEQYAAALAIFPTDFRCNRNYAVALAQYAREFGQSGSINKAYDAYCIAFKQSESTSRLNSSDAAVWFNWGNALYRCSRLLHSRLRRLPEGAAQRTKNGGKEQKNTPPPEHVVLETRNRECVCDLITSAIDKYLRVMLSESSGPPGRDAVESENGFMLTREAMFNLLRTFELAARQHNSWRGIANADLSSGEVAKHELAISILVSAFGQVLIGLSQPIMTRGIEMPPLIELSRPAGIALQALKALRMLSQLARARKISDAAQSVLGNLRPGSSSARRLAVERAKLAYSIQQSIDDIDQSMPTIVARPMRHDFHGDTVILPEDLQSGARLPHQRPLDMFPGSRNADESNEYVDENDSCSDSEPGGTDARGYVDTI